MRLILIGTILLLIAQICSTATPIENRSMGQSGSAPMFMKHRALTTSGDLVGEQVFDNSQVCSACHTDIYREWRSSIMSHAWDDPIYRALLSRASKATNGALDHYCTGCHTPVGLLTGRVNTVDNRQPPDLKNPDTELPGVDCEACHNIAGISGIDNGAYIVQALSQQKIKFGPRPNSRSPYHKTSFSSLHTNSVICATCHNVTHPVNGVPIERTYDEWYESPYREAGVSCQDCHMPKTRSKAAIMGPVRMDRAGHTFAGANTTLLQHFGHKENAQNARRLLRTSARLTIDEAPDALVPGETARVSVKVTNSGAGHKLPTGFPEGREVWLDFKVRDASGKTIYRLGAIEDGKTEPGTRNFMVRLGDKNGEKVEVEVWRVTHIISDNRILPKGHAIVDYQFEVPPDARGPLTLDIDLNYWPFSQAFADALVGEGEIDVIVEEITSLQHQLPLAVESVASTP